MGFCWEPWCENLMGVEVFVLQAWGSILLRVVVLLERECL